MQFSSDNWAGASPQISQAVVENSLGFASAYGSNDLDKAVEARFCELFEREVAVLTVATGTAANSLALALAMKPGGIALAYREAHVIEDECGAPEFFMGSGRIEPLDGDLGKISAESLSAALSRYDPPFLHHGRATALTMTQSSEVGTVYRVDEISGLAAMAHAAGLAVHMDGARFANGLVSLGVTPAEMTWKAGIDMLSFGGTKNGCWCAEALVLFDPAMRENAEYLRKRSGQLFSKNRFISAQWMAYFDNGLWLDNARHSNAMAQELAQGIAANRHARLAWTCEANEVFMIAERSTAARLMKAGAKFHEWQRPAFLGDGLSKDEAVYRLVTSFATRRQDVSDFIDALGG
ncbi:MAG: low specificity L-threonine aldolase [Nitratireductor sp.]|nr:low specificity L-threonine aldolase [Nitratireductor sp.]